LDTTLDIERPADATRWLRSRRLIEEGECPQIRVLPGGVSSRTVLVERDRERSMVLKQSLAKLRVAVDWFSSPQRIHREALAIRWFSQLAPPGTITELFFEDMEEHIIAMEAVPRPHANWKTLLLEGEVRTEHMRQFGELLAALHRNSAARAGEIRPLFQDKIFFETLRIEPYYRYTAHHAPEFIGSLIDDTLATNASLVHGDFSPKNVLIHEGRMVLLDHEVAHFGDPAFDIGFAMAHFLSKAHHLTPMREIFFMRALEFWESYRGWTPYPEFESRCVRHSLACLLARVRGRSPLEYLDFDERARQAEVTLAIMQSAPMDIPALTERFEKELACR
jgi:aminoglycoside phosphotransferase (APT) family kinase protein